jgi:hypothetical protein
MNFCPNCGVALARATAASSGPAADEGFPKTLYDHRFYSQAELDDYERRVAERDRNLDGSDTANQSRLQPGQVDITNMKLDPDLRYVLSLIGNNATSVQAFRTYGPTELMHQLSTLMTAGGIHDDGTGHIVPPPSFPELAALTVDEAKQLAGLA